MAYSNVTRMLGLNSGWDTESMVQNLMKAESIRLNRLKKDSMIISLRQQLYRGVYSDLQNFQKSFLSSTASNSIRLENTFANKITSVKTNAGQDSGAVTVGKSSKEGSYSIKVEQLAVSDMYESTSKIGGDISSAKGFVFDVSKIRTGASYEITLDGVTRKISFNEGDKVKGGTLTFNTDTGTIGIKGDNGTVTELDEQGFIGIFNEKLKNVFGTETTSGKQEIEARLTESGGISISTNGYHNSFSISNGEYNFDTAVAQEKSALSGKKAVEDSELGLLVKVGDKTTNISVSIKSGMTQQEMLDAINEQFETKGLGDKLFAHIDTDTGTVKIVNGSSTEKAQISDSVKGSLEYLGFRDTEVSVTSQVSPNGWITAEKSPAFEDGVAVESRELGFSVKIGDNVTDINVSVTAGMSQEDIVGKLNEALAEKGLEEKVSFSVNAAGRIRLDNLSSSESIGIADQSGAEGSMDYLGFAGSASTINLLSSGSLSDIGITSGSVSKFSADRTLSEIFGGSLTKESYFTINGKSFSFTGSTKMSDLMKQVNNAGVGVTMSYDKFNASFKLESNVTGYDGKISMSGELLTDNLKFGDTAKRAAANSAAVINGVTVINSSNDFSYLGVDWKLNGTTNGEELKVTVSKDTDKVVDAIKNFVSGYNDMIEKLRSLSSTSRPKYNGAYYDPLTDEEKAEMTDKEVELWEEKAKTGLLYNDSILNKIAQDLRTALNQPVTLADGSKISLYSLGITTSSDWTKGGQLTVDEDKLRKAIEKYGDGVTTLFTNTSSEGGKGIAERVNDIVNSAVSSKGAIAGRAGIAGTYTESNNELYRQLTAKNEKITLMLKQLETKENNYYNMFARMESAMSQANSQSQYISSMFGG